MLLSLEEVKMAAQPITEDELKEFNDAVATLNNNCDSSIDYKATVLRCGTIAVIPYFE